MQLYPAPPLQPVFAFLCLGLVLLRLASPGLAGCGFAEPPLLREPLSTWALNYKEERCIPKILGFLV